MWGGESARASASALARCHIIAPANGGNKQTRLSPVHTVTLAGFRLRTSCKGFAKLHVVEPRRNFQLNGTRGGDTSSNDGRPYPPRVLGLP